MSGINVEKGAGIQVTGGEVLTVPGALKKVRTLIKVPARWTTRQYARNKKRVAVDPNSPDAVCFCVVGAVKRITANSDPGMARRCWRFLRDAVSEMPGGCLGPVAFQDTHTHAETLAMVDRAIQLAEYAEKGSGSQVTGVANGSDAVIPVKEEDVTKMQEGTV